MALVGDVEVDLPAAAIPTPEQVQALIPTRGPFTTASRPTRDEVLAVIANKAIEVDMEIRSGFVLSQELTSFVRSVITYGAAADVEAGYFPEQQFGDAAASRALAATYLRLFETLKTKLHAVSVPRLRVGTMSLGSPY